MKSALLFMAKNKRISRQPKGFLSTIACCAQLRMTQESVEDNHYKGSGACRAFQTISCVCVFVLEDDRAQRWFTASLSCFRGDRRQMGPESRNRCQIRLAVADCIISSVPNSSLGDAWRKETLEPELLPSLLIIIAFHAIWNHYLIS